MAEIDQNRVGIQTLYKPRSELGTRNPRQPGRRGGLGFYFLPPRDPEMVYPRITRVKVIPRLSPGYQILKVMDNACSAYVLQCTVLVLVQSSHRAQDEALLSAAL